MMWQRLKTWKIKEVQERAHQKNLFFWVPFTFMGRKWHLTTFFFLLFSLDFSLVFLFGSYYLKSTMTRACKGVVCYAKKFPLNIIADLRIFVEKI
jgi:hypothetical protein